ncbi:hypothetical protein Lal_00050222 [Lupinus albus]|uniref:Uncharacterized protein n=1 Tax=Lupinus albus TaxID=3870 RepID=A0A6A4PMQ5_LUPAL|nr:hypothetical protein Lalb_Chr12g0203981 [Lupinus albus]KAF1867788.1 hypothetical protein Lal_00050222 [Lupinus albus]
MKLLELKAIGVGCKHHSINNKQQQQQGVCSYCLSDKLSKLNNIPIATHPFIPSPSHQLLSSSSSNYGSSANGRRHRRHASHVMDSASYMINFNVGLRKSKSIIAFAPTNKLKEMEVNRDNKGSKKNGFWSKLLKLTKKDKVSCIPGS